jgi:hypothetical protein
LSGEAQLAVDDVKPLLCAIVLVARSLLDICYGDLIRRQLAHPSAESARLSAYVAKHDILVKPQKRVFVSLGGPAAPGETMIKVVYTEADPDDRGPAVLPLHTGEIRSRYPVGRTARLVFREIRQQHCETPRGPLPLCGS